MDTLIVYFLIGVFSHFYATFMVAYEATEYGTFEAFVRAVLWRVYSGIVVAIGSFFFLGSSSAVVILFMTCVFFTLCRIDYEGTYEYVSKD
jgi:hypothetical protein